MAVSKKGLHVEPLWARYWVVIDCHLVPNEYKCIQDAIYLIRIIKWIVFLSPC